MYVQARKCKPNKFVESMRRAPFFPDEGIQGEKGGGEYSKSPALQNIQTNVFCLFFTLWSVQ